MEVGQRNRRLARPHHAKHKMAPHCLYPQASEYRSPILVDALTGSQFGGGLIYQPGIGPGLICAPLLGGVSKNVSQFGLRR